MKLPLPTSLLVTAAISVLLGFVIGRGVRPTDHAGYSASGDSSTQNFKQANVRSADRMERESGQLTASQSEFQPLVAGSGALLRVQDALRVPQGFTSIIRVLGATSQLQVEEIPDVIALAEKYTGEEREIILVGTLARWAELDPAGAAEWTKSRGADGRADRQMFEVALNEWAARNPEKARKWIDGINEKDNKEAAMRGYYGGLAVRDPAAALREIATLDGNRNRSVYETVFRSWAHKDARTAAAQAALLTDKSARIHAIRSVVQIWSTTSPREVVSWATQLPDEEIQRDVVSAALTRLASREPKEALIQVQSLPPKLRDNTIATVVETVGKQDLEEARRFAEQLPAGGARDEALHKIANIWADRDPSAAAEYVQSISPGKARDSAVASVTRAWATREPVAAAAWVAQLPAGEARVSATALLVERWARNDFKGAATWLERQPSGVGRDAGAAAFAREVRNIDPAAAMDWAAVVGDVRQREKVVRDVLEVWRRKDAAAAKNWLEGTTMIEDDLRSVLLRTP